MSSLVYSAVNSPDQRYRIVMVYDDMSENPRSWGDPLWHLRFGGREFENLSDRVKINCHGHEGTDVLERNYDIVHEDNLDLIRKGWKVVPIYGYAHSGISISLGKEYPYNDEFDGGCVGFAYLDPDKLKREIPSSIYSEFVEGLVIKTPEDIAMEWLSGEIELLDDYCSGDCFCFDLFEYGEITESCCGFYGDPDKLIKEEREIFGEHFTELFDQLEYGREDMLPDYDTMADAMEAYAL